MRWKGLLWAALGGLAAGQGGIAPVPADPLELASGPVQAANAAARKAALELLGRARNHYAVRRAGLGYDLKVRFTVDSGGETNYDGSWEMEDRFLPGQGLHWTASAAAGYSYTGIANAGAQYAEASEAAVPLRLEDVRGLLLHVLPSEAYASRETVRTAAAVFRGVAVTCVLLAAGPAKIALPAVGRAWEESEECIDPQTGLLQMHSEAPGRYVVYDYSGAPGLDGQILPKTITVNEGGRAVSTITVEKLEELTREDRSLFVPTDKMKERGRPVEMTATTKMTRVHAPAQGGGTVRPVCVLGVVSATGQLVEAHSLQPSDSNSQAAVDDARRIDFSKSTPPGVAPRQHFVFVIEKFVSR